MAGNLKSKNAEENIFTFFCTKIQENTDKVFSKKVVKTIKKNNYGKK